MNLNIATYLIFFALVAFVTIRVGWAIYKNGEHFIIALIPEDLHLVESINKMLLVGYYLLNIGYTAAIISTWSTVTTVEQLISSLCFKAGYIILGLGLVHFLNMSGLTFYKNYRNRILKKNKTTKT